VERVLEDERWGLQFGSTEPHSHIATVQSRFLLRKGEYTWLDDFAALLTAHHCRDQLSSVRSYESILPGIGPPHQLLTLRLDDSPPNQVHSSEVPQVTAMEMYVHLVGTQDDVRFVNSEDALMEAIAAGQRGARHSQSTRKCAMPLGSTSRTWTRDSCESGHLPSYDDDTMCGWVHYKIPARR
jgi:hypothetical protein